MSNALREYQMVGLPNNIDFLLRTVNHPAFMQGGVDTSFLAKHLDECLPIPNPAPPLAVSIAAVATVLRNHCKASANAEASGDPWATGLYARSSFPVNQTQRIAFVDPELPPVKPAETHGKEKSSKVPLDPHHHFAEVTYVGPATAAALGRNYKSAVSGTFTVKVGATGATETVVASYSSQDAVVTDASAVRSFEDATRGKPVKGVETGHITLTVGGVTYKASVVTADDPKEGVEVAVFPATPIQPTAWPAGAVLPHSYRLLTPHHRVGKGSGKAGGATVVTPMPGKVVKVLAKAGAEVSEGTPLMILEAMKMEHVIKAPITGVLAAVNFKEGDFVEDGRELLNFAANK